MRGSEGFTLLEAIMATVIFSFVAAAALQFLSAAKRQTATGTTQADLEQLGRQAIEILIDDIRHAGRYAFTNEGADAANTRQHSILEASNYRLAFYADANPDVHSPMESMDTDTYKIGNGGGSYVWQTFPNLYQITFPGGTATTTGATYFAHVANLTAVPDYLKRTAEVIVYSMDADADGAFAAADKAEFDAANTMNPSDAVLRRRVIGTRISGGAGAPSTSEATVARGVRVYFDTSADAYPSGDIPAPLFVYHIAESFAQIDFDMNGTLDTFIFGDCDDVTDTARCGDGRLDQAEIAALQALTRANPSDIMQNLATDARLVRSPDVLTRIRATYKTMTDADARQFLRDCIASISVNLVVEQANARPGVAHALYSADGVPYRYVQHDLSAEVFLPNAFLLSKNQLFYSSQNLSSITNDGTPTTGAYAYDKTLCPPASKDNYNCWPIR